MRVWLKNIRESKNISQMDVAKKSGISYPYYNFIENGEDYNMMKEKFPFLRKVLEITVNSSKQLL